MHYGATAFSSNGRPTIKYYHGDSLCFSTDLTTNHWQLTTDNRQTTTNNWQLTTGQGMAGITWWAKGVIWPPGVGQIFLFQKELPELTAVNVYVTTIFSDIEKLRLLYQCPTTSLQKCNAGAIFSAPSTSFLLLLLLVVYNRTFSFIWNV